MYTTYEQLDKVKIGQIQIIAKNGKKCGFKRLIPCATPECKNILKVKGKKSSGLCSRCNNKLHAAKFWGNKDSLIGTEKRPFERMYNLLVKSKNANRGIPVLLTYEQYYELCKIPNCHYCDSPLNRRPYGATNKNQKFKSGSAASLLDRKDSDGPYSIENCVPCCWPCNYMKGKYISYGQMTIIMELRKFKARKLGLPLKEYTKKLLNGEVE